MRITVGDTTYDYDVTTMGNDEAIALEEEVGYTVSEMLQALDRNSIKALTALLWLIQRRDNPALEFGDVKYKLSDLKEADLGDQDGSEAPKDA